MTVTSKAGVGALLGSAQTLAWASSYYLPAMVAVPIARDLGLQTPAVFAAFSVALVVSAILGPHAGAAIDRWGGRPVLMITNVVFAAGLAMLGSAHGALAVFVAWIVIGAAMGAGLYEAAFSALVRLFGREARGTITGITLVAGFASTVGWPLSSWLVEHYGWRETCLIWAALHLVAGLPLNAMIPRATAGSLVASAADTTDDSETAAPKWFVTAALAFVFAATWFVSTAMAAHLPRLLEVAGATTGTAVLVGSLIGASQVAARLLEFGLLRRVHPLLSARIAAVLHPIGAACLGVFGPGAAIVFGVLRRRSRHGCLVLCSTDGALRHLPCRLP